MQYNDGFRTNLIGTPQQIAERIVALKAIGVDLVLAGSCISSRKSVLRPTGAAARTRTRGAAAGGCRVMRRPVRGARSRMPCSGRSNG